MSAAPAVDLSVIIVNFNVAPLVLNTVASLQGQRFAGQDGGEGCLEILVVDNASSPEDTACLDRLPPSVAVLRNDRNVGFAAANNQGLPRAAGRYICFLNPDTRVLDGALDAMLRHLERHPEVGAVGPRIWGDDERTFLLPPGDPPTLTFLLSGLLAEAFPRMAERHSLDWHRRALAFWRAGLPCPVPMLSGACILTPRAVVDRVGGFDPGYFLYFEDTDWCRRVRRAGYGLAYVPDAEIVHYYNQSAKQDPRGARGHGLRSRACFIDAHYGLPGTLLDRAVRAVCGLVARRRVPAAPPGLIDLGRPDAPPRLRAGGAAPSRELVLQLGYDRRFVPAVAAFVRGAEVGIPPSAWDRMQPGRYFARLIDPETLTPLGLWSWEKG